MSRTCLSVSPDAIPHLPNTPATVVAVTERGRVSHNTICTLAATLTPSILPSTSALFKTIQDFSTVAACVQLPSLLRMLRIVARMAQAHAVVRVERKLRVIVAVLDVMHLRSWCVPAVPLAPLALVAVPAHDALAEPAPPRGRKERIGCHVNHSSPLSSSSSSAASRQRNTVDSPQPSSPATSPHVTPSASR